MVCGAGSFACVHSLMSAERAGQPSMPAVPPLSARSRAAVPVRRVGDGCRRRITMALTPVGKAGQIYGFRSYAPEPCREAPMPCLRRPAATVRVLPAPRRAVPPDDSACCQSPVRGTSQPGCPGTESPGPGPTSSRRRGTSAPGRRRRCAARAGFVCAQVLYQGHEPARRDAGGPRSGAARLARSPAPNLLACETCPTRAEIGIVLSIRGGTPYALALIGIDVTMHR